MVAIGQLLQSIQFARSEHMEPMVGTCGTDVVKARRVGPYDVHGWYAPYSRCQFAQCSRSGMVISLSVAMPRDCCKGSYAHAR
jgi:hypothetical protein